jgi:lipopolysaccharide export system ATP-binding protein
MTDPHDLPSANQTGISAATKGAPSVWRSQSRAPSQSDGARQCEIGRLDVQGVDKSFAGRAVVKGASLYVERGEAVALLGPSGAGKTTIFYMITGLIPADRGRIELEGHEHHPPA